MSINKPTNINVSAIRKEAHNLLHSYCESIECSDHKDYVELKMQLVGLRDRISNLIDQLDTVKREEDQICNFILGAIYVIRINGETIDISVAGGLSYILPLETVGYQISHAKGKRSIFKLKIDESTTWEFEMINLNQDPKCFWAKCIAKEDYLAPFII